jgi:hypothetical protein
MTFEHIQPCLAVYGYINGKLFPTRDPDARILCSMIRMTPMVQVPTADMLVSTTLLIVMSTIWIQEQQQIFISYPYSSYHLSEGLV